MRGLVSLRHGMTCALCGHEIVPGGPRIRLFQSQTCKVVGRWLAHFHVECGEAVLTMCKARLRATGAAAPGDSWPLVSPAGEGR